MTLTNLILWILILIAAGFAYRKRLLGAGIWIGIASLLYLGSLDAVGFWSAPTFLFTGFVLLCVLLGQPLYVILGGTTMLCLIFILEPIDAEAGIGNEDLVAMVERILDLATKEVLLAIPFFVVAGELMTQGSLAQRLIRVARACLGWMPGGLAVASVAGCVFFAAISGSSPVTVIAIGSIMVPALLKAKYPEPFAMGLLTTAGSLGILIPPSIPMIIYAIMVGTTTPMDPKDLFLGGVVPGLLLGAMLAAWSVYIGIRDRLPREEFSIARLLTEIREGFWSLLLPVIILGGIYSGVFTTTEAAAVSVVYAFVVEVFIHGELKAKQLLEVAENSMTVMGALLLIIGLALGLNSVLVLEQVPDRMVAWMQTLDLSRTSFLLIVNVFLLGLGCVMDIVSAILIVAPMLAPMASAMGVDPIHMGIIFIVNLEIGYLTPPIGLNLFVASTLFRKGLGEIISAVMPPLLIMGFGLALITWEPILSTGLVRVVNGEELFIEAKETPASRENDAPEESAPIPAETKSGTKTLQQLMEEAKNKKQGAAGPASGGRVKTLQELMNEAKNAGADKKPENAPARVKTLQELMNEAKAPRAEEERPAPDAPARVKTLQELMNEAKAKRASPPEETP